MSRGDQFDTIVCNRHVEVGPRAAAMLRAAADRAEPGDVPADFTYEKEAMRIRDAATLAGTAASELAALAGAYELAARTTNLFNDEANDG